MTIGIMDRVNRLDPADFVALFGALYEHSPWVAARAASLRPFPDPDAMLAAMNQVLNRATDAEKLALVRAHPELARRAGVDPTLTQASAAEQASAGLDRLSPEEYARFNRLNDAYAARFAMPFVICVRLSDKDFILSEMERRVVHTPEQEVRTAIVEIGKIARLRLADALARLEKEAVITLSSHVLDLVSGRPAAGMDIALWSGATRLFSGRTNGDGRCPDLAGIGALAPGAYRLEFGVAAYFRGQGVALSDPPFLDIVPIAFGIAPPVDGKGGHYHVPLLVSPYGFSTYRGS
ncbi:conserved hypothetical protein [Gluconacetobacter diazotrophicus PA1 5]|uniref:2-oxo-4-hydroxy-4-carboxy-5-ureidoimidazoline decarboxylase n=1 Tax=Gluconacetobacter diazotrophicus (strain ATCC 49037 / DSM 5601 / CCUG 37298 / CIP 103539 / LMG 7603 / PAl5) TaxID=272568 RepID=A9HJQ3_GLUDA|nr:conserved hypothetical protein [Gluconacetobacter diazotrophicus PA1 5]